MDKHPLTRKAQVLAVLKAGGKWGQQTGRDSILELFDAKGRKVDAWQQAIEGGVKEFLGVAKPRKAAKP